MKNGVVSNFDVKKRQNEKCLKTCVISKYIIKSRYCCHTENKEFVAVLENGNSEVKFLLQNTKHKEDPLFDIFCISCSFRCTESGQVIWLAHPV